MQGTPPKRWQNLIRRECPRCGAGLEAVSDSRNRLYECRAEGCEFLISRRTAYGILTDETHVMRIHLSEADRRELADAARRMEADCK
jgi:hypothetical protein